MKLRCRLPAPVCTPLLSVCLAIPLHGMSLEDFRSLPDNRVAVRTSLGVRSAEAAGPQTVRLTMGMSITAAAENPGAYRIISFDDPAYAYEHFVRPLEVETATEEEARGVPGAPFDRFLRTTATLTVPHDLKPGASYTVLAQGVDRDMVTGGHTAADFVYGGPDGPARDPRVDLAVIGLRQVTPVGSGVLRLEFGPGFAPAEGTRTSAYRVHINGDRVPVEALGRLSRVDTYLPRGWPFTAIPMHEVFLQLGRPLRNGDAIRIEVAEGVSAGLRTAGLAFHARETQTRSLKVNQVGYLPDSPVKTAYLGQWMGSFPEAVAGGEPRAPATDSLEARFWETLGAEAETAAPVEAGPALYYSNAPPFSICRADTREPVFRGRAELVHRSGDMDEGVHGVDHSGENVYRLDFSGFREPGRYFISVPGTGRSLPFRIADDVYTEAFKAQAAGVYAQRCGIALAPPHSEWRRIACHDDGIIPTTLSRLAGEQTAHEELPQHVDYQRQADADVPPAMQRLNQDAHLLAYWPLDESFRDVSGNGYHLDPLRPDQAFSDAVEVRPRGNRALGPSDSSGPNGAVTTNLPVSLENGYAVSGWVKLGGGIKFEGSVFGHLDTNVHNPRLQLTAGWGVLRAHVGIRSEPVSIGRLSDGEWHHIALVVSPESGLAGRVKVYVDGALRGTAQATEGVRGEGFYVGAFQGAEAGGKYIDEVRVYNRALSAAEVRTLSRRWGDRAIAIRARGGHHDAGDYNPRSHIDVAQVLMNAYEMAPAKFTDGRLNIPEQGNGIPDILDEAAWALRLWLGLQKEDGSVRGGTESNGDPNFIQTVELDPLGDYAFAPDAGASFTFAGAFAQAARIWRSLGRGDEADAMLERARRAYDWALEHPPAGAKTARSYAEFFLSPKAYAAAELLHTTGEDRYRQDFASAAVWSRDPEADLEKHRVYDQRAAAWAYVQCDPADADAELQAAIRRAIIRRADLFIEHCSTMAYRFIRHPWAPITWGTGAYQNWLAPLQWAYTLTGDETYRAWMVHTCDNTLGANPLGISYITGLGTRTVRAPLHNSRYSHLGEVAPGMQVQGPNQRGEGYRVQETAYPALREDFASLYTFVDCHFAIAMDEGTISSQARSMAAFGLLQPDRE